MKIPLTFQKKDQFKKGGRFNPHKFWNIYVLSFLVVLILVVLLMIVIFTKATQFLDTPSLPRIDADVRPIERIEKRVEKTESAVLERVGEKGNVSE